MKWFIKTLLHAVKGLFCKPHTGAKVGIFSAVTIILYFFASALSKHTSNEILSVCLRWIWIPVSVLYLIALYGEVVKRHKIEKFFMQTEFVGYNGKTPQYKKSVKVNSYLTKISFKSRIPVEKWKEIKTTMEKFFRKEVYDIENRKKDLITDIYLIQEDLPKFVEWRDEYMQEGRKFAVGVGYKGQEVWDASSLGHGLIAGSTGSGKTALLRCIIHQAILKHWNVEVLDFKGGGDYTSVEREAQKYRDLEDGYGPFIISDPIWARKYLLALSIEVKRRLDCFKESGVSNIDEYNAKGIERLDPWLLVIDEAAEILSVRPKDKEEKELYADIEHYLQTLARLSRAAGAHILMGFIRPSSEVLDGQIKNNLLWRVCGYFADPSASRIVLDNDRATELPPQIKGRFIIGEDEVQAYYLPIPQSIGNEDE